MTDRQTTHAQGCWSWGPAHYECAVGKIDRMRAENERLRAERDALAAALEAAQMGLRREESDHERTIDQRDAAEDALSRMFQAVTGRPAEWSSAWGYVDAIEEVEEHVAALAAMAARGEDDAWCAECGVKLENVRPGKRQHPICSQAAPQQPGASRGPDGAYRVTQSEAIANASLIAACSPDHIRRLIDALLG